MRKPVYNYIHLSFLLLSLVACGQSGKKTKQNEVVNTLPPYNLHTPQLFKLPKVHNEISGISFLNDDATAVYAEQDEEGIFFFKQKTAYEIKETKFGRKGDYEDVQICNGYVVMLRSDGTLFTFP